MVRSASLFSQLLREFPRDEFDRLVRRHEAEKRAKGFTCWTQFVSMLFCQLAGADSLREICNGLSCCLGKLAHLGVFQKPNKSTLSYANMHRPAALFEDVFWHAMARFRAGEGGIGARKSKFRFRNKLLSLDSTVISLCLQMYPWAKYRRSKAAVKAHVVLDHDDYMPGYVVITEGKKHDATVGKTLRFNPGSIVAMDRAYNDYKLFGDWTDRGVYFVTRMKDNALYEVAEERYAPLQLNILTDQFIRLTGVNAQDKCPHLLRRIVVWDERNEREIVLLTNHLEFGSTTIAAIYRDRWEIELFFKALKQTLKVKTFVGTSENALRIQIWTALIAMLLIKWLHHLSKAGWSLSNMACMLRMNLFTYRDLFDWLHDPFRTPPVIPLPQQLSLSFSRFGQPIAVKKG
jgi:hypothetical protein